MPEPLQSSPSARTACHVVELVPSIFSPAKLLVCCPTLPEEVTKLFPDLTRAWFSDACAAQNIADLVEKRQLPGITVLWNTRQEGEMTVPLPFRVPFEPIPLDEAHPALLALCEAHPTLARYPSLKPGPFLPTRIYLRAKVPVGIAFFFLMFLFLLMQALRGDPGVWANPIGIFIVPAPLTIGIPLALHWWWSPQWFLVPGAIVLRKSGWGSAVSVGICRPVDIVLIIRSNYGSSLLRRTRTFGWEASLWRNGSVIRRRLTNLECSALLAAWQSPLPSPPIDRLTDLM